MTKRLWKIAMLLFVCTLTLGFTTCGDDNDEPTPKPEDTLLQKMQGTWELEKCQLVMMGQAIDMDRDQLSQAMQQAGVSINVLNLTVKESTINDFPVEVKDNKISIAEVGGSYDILVSTITDKQMVLEADVDLTQEMGLGTATITLYYNKLQ